MYVQTETCRQFPILGWVSPPLQATQAIRENRGIALLCFRPRQRHAPAAFYPQETSSIHRTGGWVGSRAGIESSGKSCPHRVSNPGPSSP
jgi:hypothetical protein